MPITREKIEERLIVAKKQLDSLKEQFTATNGVVADLEYWLVEFDKPVEVEGDK